MNSNISKIVVCPHCGFENHVAPDNFPTIFKDARCLRCNEYLFRENEDITSQR